MTARIVEFTRARSPRPPPTSADIFPAPYIIDGEELRRALKSLGLEPAPPPKRRKHRLALRALAGMILAAALIAAVWCALMVMLGALALVAPAGAR